jgi:hypothetical protein
MKIIKNIDWEGIARLVLDSDRPYRSNKAITKIVKVSYPECGITEKDIKEIRLTGESWIRKSQDIRS